MGKSDGYYLGGLIDPSVESPADAPVHYDGGDLTTHGVIVGMTGSGKTGLGVIFLEEALRAGVPALVLDPKGDMTNLLLTFPDLQPTDFRPWIDEAKARKDDKDPNEVAAATAALWTKGLDGWGLGSADIGSLRDGAGFAIYTPGSTAGIPVNIVGSLANPGVPFDENAEALRDEIQGFVSGLLGLIGIDADPISSREHILLANLIEHSWRRGESLDLAGLLAQVQQPPLRKLGVFDIDTFFPEKDRLALAMKVNGLVASPSFASWVEGPPLDIGSLLWDRDGKPQAAVLYLAHLSDAERQFIVTLILSKVVTWMRSQSGSGELRALVYMDEVFGFVPPTAEPPAKKPILTLLKQARAFGVGMLLSTQNPVDLDYKAMSNAGTWAVGRLQTERDKARILEALKSARGDADIKTLDSAISGLGKRQFLLHSTREEKPVVFGTRWAMSYLAGPLTRDQVGTLMEGHEAAAATPAPSVPVSSEAAPAPAPSVERATTLASDETVVMPQVADGTPVFFLDAAAPWAAAVNAVPGSTKFAPAAAARVKLLYDDTRAGVKHIEEWEAVFFPLEDPFDVETERDVDYQDRDFRAHPPAQATFVLTEAPIKNKTYFKGVATAVRDHLYLHRSLEIFKNPGLKLYSRVGESEGDFLLRCDAAAEERADAEAAKLRDKYESRLRRVEEQWRAADRRAAELEADIQGARRDELMDQAGAVFDFLRGRRSTRSISKASRSRSRSRSVDQRLRTAQAKATDKATQHRDLETELVLEIEEINDKWEDTGREIETVEIGLEKTDISVEEVALVWIPVAE